MTLSTKVFMGLLCLSALSADAVKDQGGIIRKAEKKKHAANGEAALEVSSGGEAAQEEAVRQVKADEEEAVEVGGDAQIRFSDAAEASTTSWSKAELADLLQVLSSKAQADKSLTFDKLTDPKVLSELMKDYELFTRSRDEHNTDEEDEPAEEEADKAEDPDALEEATASDAIRGGPCDYCVNKDTAMDDYKAGKNPFRHCKGFFASQCNLQRAWECAQNRVCEGCCLKGTGKGRTKNCEALSKKKCKGSYGCSWRKNHGCKTDYNR